MASSQVSINIHDHGKAVDEQKRKVRCNHCWKVVSGFCRLKYHIGGIRGDVAPCEQVPPDVKELMRNKLLEMRKRTLGKEVGKLSHPKLPLKRNFQRESNVVKRSKLETTQTSGSVAKAEECKDFISEDGQTGRVTFTNGKQGLQIASNGIGGKDSSSRLAKKSIGRFLYEAGIEFSAIKSPSFQRMINATLNAVKSPSFQIPSSQELKGWILRDEVKEMKKYVEGVRCSWIVTGCSILLDGWTDQNGRHLIMFLVDCPQGTIFLRSTDISEIAEDSHSLSLLVEEVIQDVGVENLIQIVSYSASDIMRAVGRELTGRHGFWFWTVSASHCVELMLERIKILDPISDILDKAKTITKFIHNHAKVLKLMRNHTNGRDLIKPSKIQKAMPFLTLENIVSEKGNLKKMFLSPEWNNSIWASRTEGKKVADLVCDRSFWTGATCVLKAAIPLVRVLFLIDKDDNHRMGYIYETIDQAKEAICKEFKNNRALYMPIWELIDEVWDGVLHSPLHSAGYFLNPSLRYSSDFHYDSEVGGGLLGCVVHMIRDQNVQDLVYEQIDQYQRGVGVFAVRGEAMKQRNIPPVLWWSNYGEHCPELKRLAIRILNQTCHGASRFRLKRGLAEKLLAEGRNHIEQERLRDLAFVHYNLQLQHFNSGTNHDDEDEEIDPMDDWIVDGVDDIVSRDGNPSWMDLDCGDAPTTGGVTDGGAPQTKVAFG